MAMAAPAMPYIMAGMTAVSGIMSYRQQSAMAKAGERQQNIQNQLTMDAALESYSDLNAQERQASRQAIDAAMETRLQAVQERATTRLYAASAGVGGVSIDSLMSDIAYREGNNMSTIIRNTRFNQEEFRRQGEAIQSGAQRQMGTRTFNRPSALGATLSTAGAVGSGYLQGQMISDRLN